MTMTTRQALMGFAGGFASALLLLAVTSGGPLAFPLATLFPLPIAIAGLGWGSLSGLLAAASAAGFIALLTAWPMGLAFFLISGAPVAWYAHQIGLARPKDDADPAAGLEWFPIARVFVTIVALTTVTLAGSMWYGGILREETAGVFADLFVSMAEEGGPLTAEQKADVPGLAAAYLRILPVFAGISWVCIMVLNLWLAARIVKASGQLQRPWDSLPDVTVLPQLSVPVFLGAMLLAFSGGIAALIGGIATGALGMAFALIGLAVVHVRTRGNPARGLLLGLLYSLAILFVPVLALLVLVGLTDTVHSLRNKRATPPGPIV